MIRVSGLLIEDMRTAVSIRFCVAAKQGSGGLCGERLLCAECLDIELKKQGLSVRRQVKITVYYDNAVAGVFFADMVVNANVVVELKAVHHLAKMHEEQIQEYLKSSGYTKGLLINFGNPRRLEWRVY